MNLWDELMGERGDPPAAPQGSPILCGCGRRIGVESSDGHVWRAEYHHTSQGAADVLFQIVLEDFELLARTVREGESWEGPQDAVHTIVDLLDRSSVANSADLSPLAAVLPRMMVPAAVYARPTLDLDGRAPLRSLAGASAPTGCKKCRLVYDLREVMGRGVRNKRGALLVGDCEPASIAHMAYGAPPDGLRRRVALYERLSVVLSSKHSASLVGEVLPVK